MLTVSVGLSRLSVTDLNSAVLNILDHLEGNPHFPNLPFTTSEMRQSLSELMELQQRLKEGVTRMRLLRNEAVSKVLYQMGSCAHYVNSTAHGDPSILASSGFPLRKERTERPLPDVISKIKAVPASGCDEVKVFWKGVRTRSYYRLQQSTNPNEDNNWRDVGMFTSTGGIVDNLPIGQYSYFRVAAVNNKGRGPWSSITKIMVG